jgi:subtilisin family serine protease
VLAVGLIVLLALAVFSTGALAQFGTQDAEAAFAEKADKLLKQLRRAAAEDGLIEQRAGRPSGTLSRVEKLSRVAGINRGANGKVSVGVTVSLTENSDAAELEAAGFAVGALVGDIATLETDVERLPELAALASVSKIRAVTQAYPSNDRARQSIGITNSAGQRLISQTGRGVIVGVIDTGIDFRHRDFTVPGSNGTKTRIKALLDMTVYSSTSTDWNYSLPGQTAKIGRLYTEADINAALQGTGTILQKDKNGHGTHVAGTAAGNGLASPTPGTYTGMAPEADLVIVKATRQNDDSGSFRTDDSINALKFIQQIAAQRGQPFVVNMSLGGHSGPHDGTNPDERAIDQIVSSGAGRVICVAAGNEGVTSFNSNDAKIHAAGTVPAGGSINLTFNATESPDFLDLYYANSDRFTVTVTRPDGVKVGPVAYNPGGFVDGANDPYIEIYNATDTKGDTLASNDQSDIFITFSPEANDLGTNWTITVQGNSVPSGGRFDAWLGNGSFTTFVDNNSHLIGSPGTARGALTVGAYITRTGNVNLSVGNYAPFTSPGPTADGRQKPEISAPGYYLYSSRSVDVVGEFGTIGTGSNAPTDSTHYTGLAGTSMATPVVTGAVALVLQANPALTNDQIKTHLKTYAHHDGFDPPGWNSRFGFGKLNIAAVLNAIAPPTAYTISGRVANSSNASIAGVTLTMTGAAGASVQTNTSGNYSFTNVAAGTYTITPSRPGYTFSPASQTLSVTNANLVSNFTAVPLIPALLIEEGSTTRAAALDSVTQVRGPFPITTLSNFSADRYTRVMLFASNFVMGPGDDLSIVSVQAQGIPLVVESVGKVPGMDASYIVVRLSTQLPAGDLPLTVKLRGATSNTVTLGIRQ